MDNSIQIIAVWIAVFIGILGLLMFVTSLFLYAIAAGEEPKMKKAHAVLWAGITGVILAVLVYFIGGKIG